MPAAAWTRAAIFLGFLDISHYGQLPLDVSVLVNINYRAGGMYTVLWYGYPSVLFFS